MLVRCERWLSLQCSAGRCLAGVGLCERCDKRAEARREGFGRHAQGQCNDPRREIVIRAGEGYAVGPEEELYGQASGALVAILKGVILCKTEAEVCSLFDNIRTLLEYVIARACERRVKHACIQQGVLYHLIRNAKQLSVQIKNVFCC